MRDEGYTPLTVRVPVPMRVLRRFQKPGHVAEIQQCVVSQYRAFEYLIYFDGRFTGSQMFHVARVKVYPDELDARVKQFTSDGWVEDPTARKVLARAEIIQ